MKKLWVPDRTKTAGAKKAGQENPAPLFCTLQKSAQPGEAFKSARAPEQLEHLIDGRCVFDTE